MHGQGLCLFGIAELEDPFSRHVFGKGFGRHDDACQQAAFPDVLFPKGEGEGMCVGDEVVHLAGKGYQTRLVDAEIHLVGQSLPAHRGTDRAAHHTAEHPLHFAQLGGKVKGGCGVHHRRKEKRSGKFFSCREIIFRTPILIGCQNLLKVTSLCRGVQP